MGLSAASLYYVIGRGWHRKLPAVSFYVAFTCLTSFFLLALLYPRYFVHGEFRDKLCSLYADAYQVSNAAEALLLVVVVYELFALIVHGRVALQRIVKFLLFSSFLVIALSAYKLISASVESGELVPSRIAVRVVATSALVIFAAMLAFPLVQRMLRLRLKRGISHFALALAFFYPVQITLGYAAYKQAPRATLFRVLSEIWGLLFLGVLLVMLTAKNELDSPLTIPK